MDGRGSWAGGVGRIGSRADHPWIDGESGSGIEKGQTRNKSTNPPSRVAAHAAVIRQDWRWIGSRGCETGAASLLTVSMVVVLRFLAACVSTCVYIFHVVQFWNQSWKPSGAQKKKTSGCKESFIQSLSPQRRSPIPALQVWSPARLHRGSGCRTAGVARAACHLWPPSPPPFASDVPRGRFSQLRGKKLSCLPLRSREESSSSSSTPPP